MMDERWTIKTHPESMKYKSRNSSNNKRFNIELINYNTN